MIKMLDVKKIFLILVLLISLFNCKRDTTNVQEVEEYISDLEGKDLQEIKIEMSKNLEGFKSFLRFFDGTFSNEIKFVKDEGFDPVFKNDTIIVSTVINEMKDVYFLQSFVNNKTKLEFEFKNDDFENPVSKIKQLKEYHTPQKIYYHDETVGVDSLKKQDVEFGIGTTWGKPQIIDSVDISYTIRYLSEYDVVSLTPDQPVVSYRGGKIKIETIKDNYVYFTTSDTIYSPIKIEGLNSDRKSLHQTGLSYTDREPGKEKVAFTEMIEFLEKTIDKLDKKSFSNVEDLQNHIEKQASNLAFFKDNDGVFHRELYYQGTIKEVKLYIPRKYKKKKIQITAINNTVFGEIIPMPVENGLVIMNKKSEELFSLQGANYEAVTNRFYEDDDYYYHLNLDKKQMDTVFVYDINSYVNGLVGIRENDMDDKYVLYSEDYKQVSQRTYSYIMERGNLVFGASNFKYYRINEDGKSILLKNVDDIGDVNEGMTSIENEQGQEGFMDEKGRISIPMKYYKVGNFSEGLVEVKNKKEDYELETKEYYGYLDKTGKTVLPFIYDRAHEFINGIALVKFNGTYKLIDKKGEIWIETNSKGASINGKGEERVYSFTNGVEYNSYGELITE